jgi:DNA-binding NarL/FixJ family response regulator
VSSKNANRLTADRQSALVQEIKDGASNSDLAKKYGVVVQTVDYYRSKLRGKKRKSARKSPSVPLKKRPDLDAINAAIAEGKTAVEIGEEFDLSPSAITRLRSDLKAPAGDRETEEDEVVALSPETSARIIAMLGRLAEKHPRIFAQINPLKKLATKFPNVLMEVM